MTSLRHIHTGCTQRFSELLIGQVTLMMCRSDLPYTFAFLCGLSLALRFCNLLLTSKKSLATLIRLQWRDVTGQDRSIKSLLHRLVVTLAVCTKQP